MDFSIALNVVENELDACTAFCKENGLGIELTTFAYPQNLDQGFEEKIKHYKKVVPQLDFISLHGPFLDLFVTSPDPAIVEVCTKRHKTALNAAIELGADIYVAHLNSIPLISNQTYRDTFVQKAAEFWLPLADKAKKHNITIVLENMWEPDPYFQKEVVAKANHSSLKASFDNGHALVFSRKSAMYWIQELGEYLVHCHLHDNDSKYDHHWPIGEGKEDWEELAKAILKYAPEAAMVVESDSFNKNKKSLKKLRKLLDI